jgi:hypothetical protein
MVGVYILLIIVLAIGYAVGRIDGENKTEERMLFTDWPSDDYDDGYEFGYACGYNDCIDNQRKETR